MVLLPELKILEEFKSQSFNEEWSLRMEGHNGTIRKGVVMGLIREYDAFSLIFSSMPGFILTMQGAKRPTPTQSTCLYYDHDNETSKCVVQSAELARLLDACCMFGERVIQGVV